MKFSTPVSMERKLIKTIDMLESTLSKSSIKFSFNEGEDVNQTIYDESIFCNRNACLYLSMLGDSYFKLANMWDSSTPAWNPNLDEYESRSIKSFEEALRLSTSALQITDGDSI